LTKLYAYYALFYGYVGNIFFGIFIYEHPLEELPKGKIEEWELG
jgi:hypothetical protein